MASLSEAILGGVDFSLAGNGGPDCRDHVTMTWRMQEAALGTAMAVLSLILSARLRRRKRLENDAAKPHPPLTEQEHFTPVRIWLLVVFTFVYGLEFCYKLCTKQLIFLFDLIK